MGRNLNLKRRKAARNPKRRFFIFCEGLNTEPSYFNALRSHYRNTLVEIQTIGGVGVPLTIAKQAAQKRKELRRSKNSFEENDQVWAVFDCDEHPELDAAKRCCEKNKIGIGYSNPCFEVWLILHFEDYHKPDDRHAIQRHLQGLCPDYGANGKKSIDCTNLISEVEEAEKRAESQLASRANEGKPHGRPSTTVFDLTRAIREASRKSTKTE